MLDPVGAGEVAAETVGSGKGVAALGVGMMLGEGVAAVGSGVVTLGVGVGFGSMGTLKEAPFKENSPFVSQVPL